MVSVYFDALNWKRDYYLQFIPLKPERRNLKSHLTDFRRWTKRRDFNGRGQSWLVINRLTEAERSTAEVEDFNGAAAKSGFRVAICYPSFEMWLWLHLGDKLPFPNRESVIQRIQLAIPAFNQSAFDATPFAAKVQIAIERSERIAISEKLEEGVEGLAKEILRRNN